MEKVRTYRLVWFERQGGNNGGFTLVELMIAMAVSAIITAAIYSAYITQQRMYNSQDSVVEMQQNIRAALLVMSNELRMAGYDPEGSGGAGITVATANTITFSLVADDDNLDNDNADGDGDSSTGVDEPGELKTIQYDLYDAYGDGVNDIGRQVGSVKRALAEHIENVEFYYTLADGTQTLAPANLNNIRSVQISILARSGRQDRQFTNTTTYTTSSGASWGPYNDNVRRRYLETTVNLRNMGL